MERAFHPGETALQERVGVAQRMAAIGPQMIRGYMPQQHRDFFAQLPFIVAGAADAHGQPWASLLAGPPGFVTSPDETHLHVRAEPPRHDPLDGLLREGAPVGLLGIEPHTRRRNRANGLVRQAEGGSFGVEVLQSFGNCPKYIQAREAVYADAASMPGAVVRHTAQLDAGMRSIVAAADTFFIATTHPQPERWGTDVSHRGGKPGFVRVQGNTLTVPDFVGNSCFNTLGNLALEPRCGLLFVDFAAGSMLWLAARGHIVFDGPELQAFDGAQRLVRFEVTAARIADGVLPLRWSEAQLSPHLQGTGAWS